MSKTHLPKMIKVFEKIFLGGFDFDTASNNVLLSPTTFVYFIH